MNTIWDGRRKQYVVDKPFQYKATFIGLFYIIIVMGCLSIPIVHLMNSTGMLLQGRSEELVTLYENQQRYTILSYSLFFLAVTVAWIMFTIWRTHKIAGPVVKMTRYIHDIAAGEFSQRVSLRSGDQLQALASALNRMAESLEERDRLIKDGIREQIGAAKREILTSPSPERSAQAIDHLATTVEDSFDSAPEPEDNPDEPPQDEEKKPEDLVYS